VTPPGGNATTDVYAYPATSNRLLTVTRGASTVRALTYDGNGNIVGDNRLGAATTYGYNARNRLTTATSGALVWGYAYNAREQLVSRNLVTGGPDLTHFVHDIFGNVIAETNGTGPAGTTREYIWLPETEIAPTSGSRAQIDRPLGVVSGVGGPSPQFWMVHVDHLNRPSRMTDDAKAVVWNATWLPWGGVHAITGAAALDARLPGQWYQLEAGLHYNWHRDYDPTLGRYTQPDPLGFVDGPSVYGYAGGSPHVFVDPTGEFIPALALFCARHPMVCRAAAYAALSGLNSILNQLWNCGSITSWGDAAADAAIGGLTGGRGGRVASGVRGGRPSAASSGGSGGGKVKPHPDATGPHTTWKTDRDGRITRHESWEPNSKNPTGWDSKQSTDIVGRSHRNSTTGDAIPTPHTQGKGIEGGVRPAEQWEIPKGIFK
jgi:RHS repeat-associated protein